MKPCNKRIITTVIGVIAIILIPFLVNWLVALKAPNWLSPIAGTSETEVAWIGFWANYIGSILATCVAFVVLYKTLKQNEKENIRNRKDAHAENLSNSKQQVKQLSYEVAKQHLTDVRNTIVDCFMALEQDRTNDLLWELRKDDLRELDLTAQRNSISKVIDDENRAYYKLELLFPKSARNDDVSRMMLNIRKFSVESHMCLSDLCWLAQFYTDSDIDLTNKVEIGDLVHERSVKPQQEDRLSKEGYRTIDKVILEKKLFNFIESKEEVLNLWQSGRDKVNTFLLDSLNELNEYQTRMVEGILK